MMVRMRTRPIQLVFSFSGSIELRRSAYHRALEQLPGDCTEPEITQTLIERLTAALRNGIRDEGELARAALFDIETSPNLSAEPL